MRLWHRGVAVAAAVSVSVSVAFCLRSFTFYFMLPQIPQELQHTASRMVTMTD